MSSGVTFLQEFAARDHITPIYQRIDAAQQKLVHQMRLGSASAAELNARFKEQSGTLVMDSEKVRANTARLLLNAKAQLDAAGSVKSTSLAMLQHQLQIAKTDAALIRHIKMQTISNDATDKSAMASHKASMRQIEQAETIVAEQVARAKANIELVETIAALELLVQQQAEGIAAQRLIVGGSAEELAGRRGVTIATLEEAIAKERESMAGLKSALVKHQQAEATMQLNAVESIKAKQTLEMELAQRRANIETLKAAVANARLAQSHMQATAAVQAHTAAESRLSPFLARNHWLGVSFGGILERAGAGARMSGFDIGFLTFQMGQLSIAAAAAIAGLNVMADEQDSIAQLRFAAENLGISWATSSRAIEQAVFALRDATGNTSVEIREIMATLGAVTGGLIHNQAELLSATNLTLDVMRRTNASAQLASRIIARTMAGNMESLKERFPGLLTQIEDYEAHLASLELTQAEVNDRMGEFGMELLRQQVEGASEEISDAGRVVADLRNKLIELGNALGTIVLPLLQGFLGTLRVIEDTVDLLTLGPIRRGFGFSSSGGIDQLNEMLELQREYNERAQARIELEHRFWEVVTTNTKAWQTAYAVLGDDIMRVQSLRSADMLSLIFLFRQGEEEITEAQEEEMAKRKELARREMEDRIAAIGAMYRGARTLVREGESRLTGIVEFFTDAVTRMRENEAEKLAIMADAYYRAQEDRQRAAEESAREHAEEIARILREMRQEYIDSWNEYMEDRRAQIMEEAALEEERQLEITRKVAEGIARRSELEKRELWERQDAYRQFMEYVASLDTPFDEQLRVIQDGIGGISRATEEAREAWTREFEGVISGWRSIGGSLTSIMSDALGQKGLVWWIEGLAQVAYAAANWYNPFAAAQHGAAAAAFFYAATQAGRASSSPTRAGGGRRGRQARIERRRQTLEEAPDTSLRSPSGLTFMQFNDFRHSVGLDGGRVGIAIMDRLNRGARLRSGHRLDESFVNGWRR